VLRYELN